MVGKALFFFAEKLIFVQKIVLLVGGGTVLSSVKNKKKRFFFSKLKKIIHCLIPRRVLGKFGDFPKIYFLEGKFRGIFLFWQGKNSMGSPKKKSKNM